MENSSLKYGTFYRKMLFMPCEPKKMKNLRSQLSFYPALSGTKIRLEEFDVQMVEKGTKEIEGISFLFSSKI